MLERSGSTLVHTETSRNEDRSSAVLKSLRLSPIAPVLAKEVIVANHYLPSMPGGTKFCIGVFSGERLSGVMTLGCGPIMAHALVEGAAREECMALTRFWLSEDLPPNSASRVLSMLIRSLKQDTDLKFLITYADPSHGHNGTIYQASNWDYIGLSQGTPLYDLGDGIARHSRSLGHVYGTHDIAHFKQQGIDVRLIPQAPKHRYIYFLDKKWQSRLRLPILPYPKGELS